MYTVFFLINHNNSNICKSYTRIFPTLTQNEIEVIVKYA